MEEQNESEYQDEIEFETQTDIVTLLENVKCQRNNIPSVKQALMTLAHICSAEKAQDYFRQIGGIKEMLKLLSDSSCPGAILPVALFCFGCTVQGNAISQQDALSENLMTLLHGLLSSKKCSNQMIQSSAFLITCLVAGNSRGQALCFQTGCLQDLINLIRSSPSNESGDESLWSSITSAIGVSVNNPQNDNNQRVCCSLLPHLLKMITEGLTSNLHKHTLDLINLIVANNAANQERMHTCYGIAALVDYLQKFESKDKVGQISDVQICSISALNACVADHKTSAVQAASLGAVHALINLLSQDFAKDCHIQTIILTLAHILEYARSYCQLLRQHGGYEILVRLLTESEDEELIKVVKYVLNMCKTYEPEEKKDQAQFNKEQGSDHLFLRSPNPVIENHYDDNMSVNEDTPRSVFGDNLFVGAMQRMYHMYQQTMTSGSGFDFTPFARSIVTQREDRLQMSGDTHQNVMPLLNSYTNRNTDSRFQNRDDGLASPISENLDSVFRSGPHGRGDNGSSFYKPSKTFCPSTYTPSFGGNDTQRNASSFPQSTDKRVDGVAQQNIATGRNYGSPLTEVNPSLQTTPSHNNSNLLNVTEKERFPNVDSVNYAESSRLRSASQRFHNPLLPTIESNISCSGDYGQINSAENSENGQQCKELSSIQSAFAMFQDIKKSLAAVTSIFVDALKGQRNIDMDNDVFGQENRDTTNLGTLLSSNHNQQSSPQQLIQIGNDQTHEDVTESIQTDNNYATTKTIELSSEITSNANENTDNLLSGQDPLQESNTTELAELDKTDTIQMSQIEPTDKDKVISTPNTCDYGNTKHDDYVFVKPFLPVSSKVNRAKAKPKISPNVRYARSDSTANTLKTPTCSTAQKAASPVYSEFDLRIKQAAIKQAAQHQASKPSEEHPQRLKEGTQSEGILQDPRCPGCSVGSQFNSWTYNIQIESSPFTCNYHREIRIEERKHIKKEQKSLLQKEKMCKKISKHISPNGHITKSNKDVYDFTSESDQELSSPEHDVSMTSLLETVGKRKQRKRRPRIDYSDEELHYLQQGVATMGKSWQHILNTYPFHPTRTSVDLKEKHRRLVEDDKASSTSSRTKQIRNPFSMCEIRRLKAGVKMFGYNWKAILSGGKFLPQRTAEDLRNKWRLLNRSFEK